MQSNAAYHILRIGLGITFLWIGVLIFRSPEFWGGFLQPWAIDFLPVPLREAMIGSAVLDAIIGLALLVNVRVWIAALLGSIHLAIILVTCGITEITVRDIGLLGGTIALFWTNLPDRFRMMVKKMSGGKS